MSAEWKKFGGVLMATRPDVRMVML